MNSLNVPLWPQGPFLFSVLSISSSICLSYLGGPLHHQLCWSAPLAPPWGALVLSALVWWPSGPLWRSNRGPILYHYIWTAFPITHCVGSSCLIVFTCVSLPVFSHSLKRLACLNCSSECFILVLSCFPFSSYSVCFIWTTLFASALNSVIVWTACFWPLCLFWLQLWISPSKLLHLDPQLSCSHAVLLL